jgi:hypothetical protein
MLQHALGSRMGGGEGLQWQTTGQVSKQINIKHRNDGVFLLIPLSHVGAITIPNHP